MPDAIDRQLVNALQRDGRADVDELARETDAVRDTAGRRLRGLEDEGVIEGYVPRLDYAALGYEVTALVRLRVDGTAVAAVADRLREHPQVTTAYQLTDDHNVFAVAQFRAREDLSSFVTDLVTTRGVGDVAVDLATATHSKPLEVDVDLAEH